MKVHDLTELQWIRAATANGEARSIRIDANLSQAEISNPIGVSASTISLWEAGERRPTGKAALRYAKVLRTLAKLGEVGL